MWLLGFESFSSQTKSGRSVDSVRWVCYHIQDHSVDGEIVFAAFYFDKTAKAGFFCLLNCFGAKGNNAR